MIYPTRLAIAAAAAGAPFALLIAALAAGRWYLGLAWCGAVLAATIWDGFDVARAAGGEARLDLPATAPVGGDFEASITLAFAGRRPPSVAQVALEGDPLVTLADDGRARVRLQHGRGAVTIPATAIRRGSARFASLWLRWRGSLGLVWRQRRIALGAAVAIVPDMRPVRSRGAQIFQRQALQGLIAQIDRGDGADFDALVEYRSGMDRRAIDWRQSARHQKLHAKEFRVERNNQLVFAVDSGRQMCEPVAGLPRIDRAVSAMLLTAWIALKLGDRVALTAFDSCPRIASGLVGGAAGLPELQRLAAGIDYSAEETNYTFALATLAARLTRRSMIVLFTEFTDPIAADFMVRAAARLIHKHLLLVVVLRDEELEAIADAAPVRATDITRAVMAAGLLRERLTVLTRLRHLGAHIVESPHDQVPERLVAAYLDLKRRNLL